MVLSRRTWLAVALAGALAGCSELRWQRRSAATTAPTSPPAPTKTVTEMLPAVPASANAPPTYSPALYIPGSAGASPPKTPEASLPMRTLPGAATETTLPPLTPSDPATSDHPLAALQRKAAVKWASIDAYGCRMRRREVVAGQAKPEELVDAKFRKEPFSVAFQWIGPEGKGREVVYVQGQHGNQIHTLTATGDVPLVPGGGRFKIAPDSLLVRNRSRTPITEAGVGSLIERFGKLIDGVERGDPRAGTAKYMGQLKRKEFETKVEAVLQSIPPGREPLLPAGGQRLWCFDPEHGLPVLIVTHDETSREVEYTCHDRFEFGNRFSDEVFHPDHLGKKAPQRPAAE